MTILCLDRAAEVTFVGKPIPSPFRPTPLVVDLSAPIPMSADDAPSRAARRRAEPQSGGKRTRAVTSSHIPTEQPDADPAVDALKVEAVVEKLRAAFPGCGDKPLRRLATLIEMRKLRDRANLRLSLSSRIS